MRIYSSARILVIAIFLLALTATSFGQIGIAIHIGPPAIPVYTQPPCPAEGYIWTPGYWAYDYDYNDYYWVPGTWVLAPQPGFLWTPGWWGWGGAAFIFHEGYWGPHVGFYGGINYGFGYFGNGFEGGRWENNHFFYNRSVTNVNVTNVTNVYHTTVVNRNETRISYNGGNGGINARPSPEQERYDQERHVGPVAAQTQHLQAARGNPELRASANHGKPPIAATQRPNEFRGEGVVPAKEAGGEYKGGENRGENGVPKPPTHAKDLSPHEKLPAPNTGNDKLNAKYQQQQDKMAAKQEQEHQKMAQKQNQEDEKMARQNANAQKQQQMEQRHAQQTQQMEQHHTAQTQQMQQRSQPHPPEGGGHGGGEHR
jgi:WXXGXW repeat (2 copies)